MRIAICEDRRDDACRLQAILTRYLQTQALSAEVDFFENGESFLSAFRPGRYPIIFMDIFMAQGGLSGMEVAEAIHTADEEAAIILTTTSEDFGIAGYNVAVYYIVKPVTEAVFLQAMKKCRGQIDRYGKTIDLLVNRHPAKLRLHDIRYVEAQRKACVFMTADGELRANMIFDTLTATLSGLPFLRCHRSYIVNLAHVQDMQGRDFIIGDGHKIPISRTFLPEVQRKFQQFLKDELRGRSDTRSAFEYLPERCAVP